MVADEPAVLLPQRDLRRREVLPAARAPVAQPGQAPADAGADVPVPVPGFRGQVPRIAARHARTGSGARQPVPADPPDARRRAPRSLAALAGPERYPPAPGAHRALVAGGTVHPDVFGRDVRRFRLGTGRTTRDYFAAVRATRPVRGCKHG